MTIRVGGHPNPNQPRPRPSQSLKHTASEACCCRAKQVRGIESLRFALLDPLLRPLLANGSLETVFGSPHIAKLCRFLVVYETDQINRCVPTEPTTMKSREPYLPPSPSSTTTSFASPPPAMHANRPITAQEEARLIGTLDDQIATISSRYTRRSVHSASQDQIIDEHFRHQEGGYTSLKRLAKDYHHLLQTLLRHQPPAKRFMTAQYLIRIVGDFNEQLPNLSVPEDPRGVFYVLKQIDEAVVGQLSGGAAGMSTTERVRLRNELERGRGIVAATFEEYHGTYKVEDAIGRVYEKSLEEMEEPFDLNVDLNAGAVNEFEDDDRLQEDILEDVDVG